MTAQNKRMNSNHKSLLFLLAKILILFSLFNLLIEVGQGLIAEVVYFHIGMHTAFLKEFSEAQTAHSDAIGSRLAYNICIEIYL